MKTILITIMMLFLTCNVATAQVTEQKSQAAETVKQKTKTAKSVNAAKARSDRAALDSLINAAMRDKNWRVRESACQSLGNYKYERAIKVLVRELNDVKGEVRSAAGYALNEIGTSSVPSLRKALKHRNAIVRSQAAEILGELKAKSAVAELSSVLKKDPDGTVRASAASALGSIKSNSTL